MPYLQINDQKYELYITLHEDLIRDNLRDGTLAFTYNMIESLLQWQSADIPTEIRRACAHDYEIHMYWLIEHATPEENEQKLKDTLHRLAAAGILTIDPSSWPGLAESKMGYGVHLYTHDDDQQSHALHLLCGSKMIKMANNLTITISNATVFEEASARALLDQIIHIWSPGTARLTYKGETIATVITPPIE